MQGWISHFFYFKSSQPFGTARILTLQKWLAVTNLIFFFSRGACTFFCSFSEHMRWNGSILSSIGNGYLYRCILQLVEGNMCYACYVCIH